MTFTPFSERRVQREALRLDTARTAVLVVDMLNDFVDLKGLMPLEGGEVLFPPHLRLLDTARRTGARVIWVCDTHAPDDREFDKREVHCLTGTWGAEIPEGLGPRDDEERVYKRRYSGFFETDLDLRLRERDIRHVIVTGVVTNICVRSTCHDAFFRGYDVIVPEECVMATGPREQESSLYDIDTHYGTVTGIDEVLTALETGAKR